MIGFIIGAALGTILGFTACALLTVDKVKPRLPDHRSDVTDSDELKQKALEYLRQMNPPPICKVELQAVDVEAVIASRYNLSSECEEDLRLALAEKVGRKLLAEDLLMFAEQLDCLNMETKYRARVSVLKQKEGEL